MLGELRSFLAAPSFDAALHSLVHGPRQQGTPEGTAPSRIMIGWGRQDRVTSPRQAARAIQAFPDAQLHWFSRCGHFPQWDAPEETSQLILRATA